ncbi:MAG: hypothetical protein FJ102_04525 [Deltaproteobacteria bacterium]|nr:hypothetical protein [Deltaproteobacteria bacterium]
MLALLATAMAATFDIVTDDSVTRAALGNCPSAEPRLLDRVDRDPDDLAARVALDGCRVGGAALETALADLASLYQVGAPFDPGLLLKRRDTQPGDREKLLKEAQVAGGFLVRALVEKKRWSDAQVALYEMDKRVGASAPLAAAKVVVERGQNGAAAAWTPATTALYTYPEDADVLEQVALVVFDDGARAPADVIDAVLVRGRPSAKLNVLIGLARAGRGKDCLARVDSVRVPEDYAVRLRAASYRCAVTGRDLDRASAIVAKGSTGLDARVMAEHAEIWLSQGANEAAYDLVEPIVMEDSKAAEVALRALQAMGRDAEMTALAAKLPSTSVARLAAAVALFNARRYDAALALLPLDCFVYSGTNVQLCESARLGSLRAPGR